APSCASPRSRVASLDRERRKTVGAAVPPSTAGFLIVVVTLVGRPRATALGVAATDDVTVTLCTRRSGRTTRSAIARVLLPSLASLISTGGALVMSARRIRKYEPAVSVFGSVTEVTAVDAAPAARSIVTRRVPSN